MQAYNIVDDALDGTHNAHFDLAVNRTLTTSVGWCNNDGEKWTFDVVINLLDGTDYDYTASHHFDHVSLNDALEYLGVEATQEEKDVILAHIIERHSRPTNDTSAHDSYYGV
jgi:predicted hydrolase (HD superfamily)